MDVLLVLKTLIGFASAAAAWIGYRKLQAMLAAYRETVGPRPATPSTSLVFRWSGKLRETRFRSLVLRIGNQERRTIILQGAEWSVPRLRLKWTANLGTLHKTQLAQGEGVVLELDPRLALDAVEKTPRMALWHNRVRIICGLRLVLHLQSGELIPMRIPGAMRSFLAIEQGLSTVSRGLVWLHAKARP